MLPSTENYSWKPHISFGQSGLKALEMRVSGVIFWPWAIWRYHSAINRTIALYSYPYCVVLQLVTVMMKMSVGGKHCTVVDTNLLSVTWQEGQTTKCWFVGVDDLTGCLHVLEFPLHTATSIVSCCGKTQIGLTLWNWLSQVPGLNEGVWVWMHSRYRDSNISSVKYWAFLCNRKELFWWIVEVIVFGCCVLAYRHSCINL